MKKLMTLAVCLFAFIGLTKADDDKPITVEQLPQKAQQFIKQYFADKTVTLAKMERDFMDKSYEVLFSNGEKVEFDKNGEWKDVDCKQSVVPALPTSSRKPSRTTWQRPIPMPRFCKSTVTPAGTKYN